MAASFDRLVGRLASVFIPCLLAGCQSLTASAPGVDDAPACPVVIEAEAWVNHMPGVGSSPAKLVVSLKIDSEAPWMLAPVASDEQAVMRLNMVPGGNSLPGRIGFRSSLGDTPVTRIDIACSGDIVAQIDSILLVQ